MTDAALCSASVSLALLVSGPLTGYLSDQVWQRRKLPYTLLVLALLACWLVFALTLGAQSLAAVYALFLAMGAVGAAFVLTWPIAREVNAPHLAGMAVAVANLGGFLGAALTQGPIGAVLDAGWTGAMAHGARVYPLAAYRNAFLVCAAFVLAAAALSLLLRETRGRSVAA
jgi:MFS family permease